MNMYAAIEAGGNMINCAIFAENRNKLDAVRVDTTTPENTLARVCNFFQLHNNNKVKFEALGPSHSVWNRQTSVLSQVGHNLLVSISPQKIIMGGGVMFKSHLLEQVIDKISHSLNGYLTLPRYLSLRNVIVFPQLGGFSGLYGVFALPETAALS